MADTKTVKKLGERYWEPEPEKPQRIAWVSDKPMPPGVSLPSVGYIEFPSKEFESEWAHLIVAAVAGFKVVRSAPKTKPAEPKPTEGVK